MVKYDFLICNIGYPFPQVSNLHLCYLLVYLNPWIKPPADFRQSKEWVIVPAGKRTNRNGTFLGYVNYKIDIRSVLIKLTDASVSRIVNFLSCA